jgi:hypothetical protein
MKKFLTLSILFLFLINTCISQIEFNSKFKKVDNGNLPYGEPVVFFGTLENTVDSLIVSVSYPVFSSDGGKATKTITKRAEVMDLDWNVIFESLPADSKIIISFKLKRIPKKEEIESLSDLLSKNYYSTVTNLTNGKFEINAPPDVAKSIIIQEFKRNLDPIFKNFVTNDAQNLYSKLAISLSETGITELQAFINNSRKINSFRETLVSILSKLNLEQIKDEKIKLEVNNLKIESLLVNPVSGSAVLDTLKKIATNSTFINQLDDLKNLLLAKGAYNGQKTYTTRYQEMKNFENASEALEEGKLLVSQSIISYGSSESAQSNELLKYAGIDVAAIPFPKSEKDRNPAFVGYYFCISPYLHEIFGLTPKRKWMSNLTPTLGIGLSTSLAEVKNSFFYSGISYRLNKAFRFTAGATFFKNDITKAEFEWMFGAGFTLELASVGNLLKLFNSSQSQFSTSSN